MLLHHELALADIKVMLPALIHPFGCSPPVENPPCVELHARWHGEGRAVAHSVTRPA